MTETVKNLAPKILEIIKSSNSILLHCHPSPDPDSVGSALAMKFALESLGKKVTIIGGDSPTPADFSHFPGFDSIVQKNLFEINLDDYGLFLIQDCGSPEMISRRGTEQGTSQTQIVFPQTLKTIIIDHHISNPKYAREINLVDPTYPATALILYDLFKEWGIVITPEIATNLFIGTYTDTGGFRYGGHGAETLSAAAELARIAPNFSETIFKMENNRRPQALIFQGLAFSNIETFSIGTSKNDQTTPSCVAISSVAHADLLKNMITSGDVSTTSIPNILKSVVGWDIGVSLVELDPGKIKVSMRTRDSNKYDLSVLAKKIGGGGHKAAAGAMITGTLAEARKKIVDAIQSVI